MVKPIVNIGGFIYHITPDSPRGVVVDITYSYLTKQHSYCVAFSAEAASMWYYEHELSLVKVF